VHQKLTRLRIISMQEDIQKLFSKIKVSRLETGLMSKILLEIREQERKSAERRLFLHLVIIFSGMFVFYYYIASTITILNEGGFWQYLSLLFSDFGAILASWQPYALSLLEVLPVTGLIILLSATLLILNSLKYFVEALNSFSYSRRIMHKII